MKNQTYRMTMLFDFYGEILTDRQKEFFDLYYNEDLSLAEIAENYGISRQGVRDALKRGEEQLYELEHKLGLMKRDAALLQAVGELKRIADALPDSMREKETFCAKLDEFYDMIEE